MTGLAERRHELTAWLFDQALPLWWEKGADTIKGGFYERLNMDGTPDDINRRTRVAARQVYSYALAQTMGYEGETKGPIDQGLSWLSGPARAGEGLLYAVLTPAGDVVRGEFDFYDHAFALLAYASAYRIRPLDQGLRVQGEAIRARLLSDYKHPVRGFEESSPRTLPLKANPHMHLFEACLAWIEAGGDQQWYEIAAEIADLCLDKFLHPQTGALREFFDADWNPMAGDDGRIIEPGHQFEWAWLFIRWAKISGRYHFIAPARRLIAIAEAYGTDPVRGVTFNELWDDFTPKDENARLWPQTERIKAMCALYNLSTSEVEKAHIFTFIVKSVDGLSAYLKTQTKGLYRDKMLKDASFIDEPAPASTLYHIICAIDELKVF
jgi:mannose/cellobiose epimerase-like protein (N-acyl-D-glucosamine 2-epimerase family)